MRAEGMRKFLGLCAVALGAVAATAHGDSPVLRAGTNILDGSVSLVVDGCAQPFVVDWNNDGKKDLLVGQFSSQKIRLYLNQGTDANPVFSGYSYLQAAGSDISLPDS